MGYVLDAAGDVWRLICLDGGKKIGVEEDKDKISAYNIHLQQPYDLNNKVQFLKEEEMSPIWPHMFKHELLQIFVPSVC